MGPLILVIIGVVSGLFFGPTLGSNAVEISKQIAMMNPNSAQAKTEMANAELQMAEAKYVAAERNAQAASLDQNAPIISATTFAKFDKTKAEYEAEASQTRKQMELTAAKLGVDVNKVNADAANQIFWAQVITWAGIAITISSALALILMSPVAVVRGTWQFLNFTGGMSDALVLKAHNYQTMREMYAGFPWPLLRVGSYLKLCPPVPAYTFAVVDQLNKTALLMRENPDAAGGYEVQLLGDVSMAAQERVAMRFLKIAADHDKYVKRQLASGMRMYLLMHGAAEMMGRGTTPVQMPAEAFSAPAGGGVLIQAAAQAAAMLASGKRDWPQTVTVN